MVYYYIAVGFFVAVVVFSVFIHLYALKACGCNGGFYTWFLRAVVVVGMVLLYVTTSLIHSVEITQLGV